MIRPKLENEQWTRINQIHELVKQEGDARCEAAFDDLISIHNKLVEWDEKRKRDIKYLLESERELAKKIHTFADEYRIDKYDSFTGDEYSEDLRLELLIEHLKNQVAFFDNQHAAAMETVGRLCDEKEDLTNKIKQLEEQNKNLRISLDLYQNPHVTVAQQYYDELIQREQDYYTAIEALQYFQMSGQHDERDKGHFFGCHHQFTKKCSPGCERARKVLNIETKQPETEWCTCGDKHLPPFCYRNFV